MPRFIDSQLGHRPSGLKVAPPADDPTVLFKASDVFVSASRAEAFSFAIGDAMVAERPVVASNLRGPSAFYGGGGVFLFESGDANDLTRALRQVLTADATTRTRWGRDNRRYVSDHLNLEDHAQNVTDTYSRLLARPRNGVLAARHGASRLDV
jgi:glycosyltransferase involved in cell wall biosynthesis